jgi:hypothetical protein
MNEFEEYITKSMSIVDDEDYVEYTPNTLTVKVGNDVFKCNGAVDNPDSTIKVRHGNKVFSYKVESVDEEFDVETIKNEIKEIYSKRLSEIKTKVTEYIQEFKFIYDKEKKKVEDKKLELDARLQSSNIMPEITEYHLQQGLSVVKGSGDGSFIWTYKSVYHPKIFGGKVIDPTQSKKMITPINIIIKTTGESVTKVVVMRSVGWSKFEHYHSMGIDSDCWGDWKYSNHKYKTPDDIIEIGKHASAVLERINPHSFGNQSPKGLPRPATIRKYLLDDDTNINEVYNGELTAGRDNQRSGINTDILSENNRLQNVWSA